jgi:ribosomal protein L12E/L44/L45/RPP1/RPP2
MANTKKECAVSGKRYPVDDMQKFEIEVETGKSQSGISIMTFIGALVGNKASINAIKRKFFNSSQRNYYRKKTIWISNEHIESAEAKNLLSRKTTNEKSKGNGGCLTVIIYGFIIFTLASMIAGYFGNRKENKKQREELNYLFQNIANTNSQPSDIDKINAILILNTITADKEIRAEEVQYVTTEFGVEVTDEIKRLLDADDIDFGFSDLSYTPLKFDMEFVESTLLKLEGLCNADSDYDYNEKSFIGGLEKKLGYSLSDKKILSDLAYAFQNIANTNSQPSDIDKINAILILNTITADKEIRAEEVQYVTTEFGVEVTDEIKRLLDADDTSIFDISKIDYSPIKFDIASRDGLLDELLKISKADSTIDFEEKGLIKKISTSLGYNYTEAEQLFE